MNVISLYRLDGNKLHQTKEIHAEARILSVCVARGEIMVAIEEDTIVTFLPKEKKREVEFLIFRNPYHVDVDGYTFLGTVVLDYESTKSTICHVLYRNI